MTTASAFCISGRYTLEELSHLAGTLVWNRGIPETWHPADEEAVWALVRQAKAYLEATPKATVVDVLEGQIVNVS